MLELKFKKYSFSTDFLNFFYTLKNCMSEFSQCSKTKDDKYNREEERINRKLESKSQQNRLGKECCCWHISCTF